MFAGCSPGKSIGLPARCFPRQVLREPDRRQSGQETEGAMKGRHADARPGPARRRSWDRLLPGKRVTSPRVPGGLPESRHPTGRPRLSGGSQEEAASGRFPRGP